MNLDCLPGWCPLCSLDAAHMSQIPSWSSLCCENVSLSLPVLRGGEINLVKDCLVTLLYSCQTLETEERAIIRSLRFQRFIKPFSRLLLKEGFPIKYSRLLWHLKVSAQKEKQRILGRIWSGYDFRPKYIHFEHVALSVDIYYNTLCSMGFNVQPVLKSRKPEIVENHKGKLSLSPV